jgi:hypothetical protein
MGWKAGRFRVILRSSMSRSPVVIVLLVLWSFLSAFSAHAAIPRTWVSNVDGRWLLNHSLDEPVIHAALERLAFAQPASIQGTETYFPPPESQGGWRTLEKPEDIRRLAGMDPDKLADLKQWLLDSDDRNFAAVVIRHGYVVLELERGNSAKTDSRRSRDESPRPRSCGRPNQAATA